MRPTREQDLAALLTLLRIVPADLAGAYQRLHEEAGVNRSDLTVLERLADDGAATVPDLARAQGVSRQHVQQVCNGLAARGLIAWGANPAHRRSRLAAVTDEGYKTVDQARMRESRFMLNLAGRFSASALDTTRRTLESLRTML
ncbi:MAG: hypothetical protein CMJ42_21900 [Phyllobacteriaceae bacterium]|nr:hypothetical protein [Phyllobacteriaceae bacterium]MBA92569.1 hypothetical protein [Phyllobacteriaceae bacterium]